ncbi:MAG: hypothetical protein ACRC51_04135 [Cetobacterium sp.]
MNDFPNFWISEEKLALKLGVTTKWIRQICKESKNQNKESEFYLKYNFLESVMLFVNYSKNSKKDYALENKKMDTKLKEYKLKIMADEYVDKKKIIAEFEDMLAYLKNTILQIPSALARELEGKDQKQIEEILIRAIEKTLSTEDDEDEK